MQRRQHGAAILRGVLFVGFLAFQGAFFLSCFLADYGCPLTWVMFSGRSPIPEIFVEWQAGGETSVHEIEETLGIARVLGGKMDRARFMPAYLCDNLPGVRAVRLDFIDSNRTETIPCKP